MTTGPIQRKGCLIVNADDWGRDFETTDKTLACVRHRTVSSVSAMVFMEDSERSAAIALAQEIDAGLHLNLTSPFTRATCPARLAEHQERVARFLLRARFAQAIFHPGLTSSFRYVVNSQMDEFQRLYGRPPGRIDGHHHMHLCANVLLQKLLPAGIVVRKNFSFLPGERHFANRWYRGMVDRHLAKRYRLSDYFFSLPPFQSRERLSRIFSLAHHFCVEVETHPANPDEYEFLLAKPGIFSLPADLAVAPHYVSA